MGDYQLLMQFEVEASRSELSSWLTSAEGIAGWWSDRVEGAASAVGDRFQVHFPESPVAFELEVVEATEEAVEWRVGENPPPWQGTTIRFDLSDRDESGSQFLFRHGGFDPDNPVIPIITPAWVHFLDTLKRVAETGVAAPLAVNRPG